MPVAPPTGFLDPATLARIGDLQLLARTVVDGFMHGLHRAPRLGHSVDFAEYRPYMPGDDIRRIDWRVYGRTDRFYVKEYEADTNASVVIAVDVSGSMNFGSAALTKFGYAQFLAASLAWFSQRQGDRVGLVTFTDKIVEYVPPSTRHLPHVLHALERARPEGAGSAPSAIANVAQRLSRTGIFVCISDWYADPEEIRSALGEIRVRGHDVIAFHLLDPAERDFPYDDPGSFEDLESGERLSVVPAALKERYQKLVRGHLDALETGLGRAGVDYALFDTRTPLDHALYQYLIRREAQARVR